MSSSVPTFPLGNLASFKTGKLDSNAAENAGSYPFFTCSPDTLMINQFAFNTEAVLLAGNNANGNFSVKYYSGKFNAYQRTYVIEPLNPDQLSCKYLYYQIRYLVNHLKDLSVGSATKFLTKKTLESLHFKLPSKNEQDQITEILSALDERIILLQEMNATLESIAQALFKSWFIDFDPVHAKAEGREPEGMDAETAALFPDNFEESELGLIPKGWRVGTLSDLATLNPESWSNKNHPETVLYIDLANAKENIINEITEYSFDSAPSRARRVLRDGDSIIGTVRPGNRSFALINNAPPNLTGSTGFAVLRPCVVENTEFLYLAMTTDANIDYLTHVADGGAYPAVRPEVVINLKTILPTPELILAYHSIVKPLLICVSDNHRKIQSITGIRDALLPRLISGQLHIENEDLLSRL